MARVIQPAADLMTEFTSTSRMVEMVGSENFFSLQITTAMDLIESLDGSLPEFIETVPPLPGAEPTVYVLTNPKLTALADAVQAIADADYTAFKERFLFRASVASLVPSAADYVAPIQPAITAAGLLTALHSQLLPLVANENDSIALNNANYATCLGLLVNAQQDVAALVTVATSEHGTLSAEVHSAAINQAMKRFK